MTEYIFHELEANDMQFSGHTLVFGEGEVKFDDIDFSSVVDLITGDEVHLSELLPYEKLNVVKVITQRSKRVKHLMGE